MTKEVSFITSFLTFYMKGTISIADRMVQLSIPNTVLKLIPLGSYKRNVPINQISSVETSFSLNFKSLIFGIILLMLGLGFITENTGLGIVGIILGLNSAVSSFQTFLLITLTSGKVEGASFIIFEKNKAIEIADAINAMITNRLDDTNNRIQTDRIVDAIQKK